jgi:hypothetical protein
MRLFFSLHKPAPNQPGRVDAYNRVVDKLLHLCRWVVCCTDARFVVKVRPTTINNAHTRTKNNSESRPKQGHGLGHIGLGTLRAVLRLAAWGLSTWAFVGARLLGLG